MIVQHHPDITTLMAFSAGTLDTAFATVVATHVAMCAACTRELPRLDAIGGALLAAQGEAALAEGALERLFARLDEPGEPEIRVRSKDSRVPAPLARHLPDGLDQAPWRRKGPGVWTCELPVPDTKAGRLMLLKVAGGQKMPEHSHGGQELTLILDGAYNDRFGRFGVGDIADHDQEVEHQPIAEAGRNCICLVALDAPLTFRSRLMRLIQPLIGL